MPLLNPQQQYYLSSRKFTKDHNGITSLNFFQKFTKYASELLTQKLISIHDYIDFEDCFLENIDSIKSQLGISIPSKGELGNKEISDYFKYFYELLHEKDSTDFSFKNTFYINYKTSLFLFEVYRYRFFDKKNESRYCWYFTDSHFAILVIENIAPQSLINLEILLLKSIGLTLVLIYTIQKGGYETFNQIHELIKKKYFSEIHININDNNLENSALFSELFIPKTKEKQDYPDKYEFYGYFYLYSSLKINYTKTYKSNPYCIEIVFSLDMRYCISQISSNKPNDETLICSFTSKKKYLKIFLCEVPLFDEKYEENSLTPSKISEIEFCYIKQEDFLFYKGTRVKVLFKDTIKYVNFNDIHLMRPEFFITNMLHLMKMDLTDLVKDLNAIKEEANAYSGKISVNKMHNFFKLNQKKIINSLSYLYYAMSKINKITLHDNQIFSIYESCLTSILNDNSEKKGVIYQLETGEGKSYVVQLIALLLVTRYDFKLIKNSNCEYPKIVHIASSNIYLAKRDFCESYKFFEEFKIKSSVLLHKKELNCDKFYGSKDIDIELFKSPYYSDDKFKNSLEMNFIACGFDSNFKENKDCPRIVFSTFVNFEALYLMLIEKWNQDDVNKYFKKCSLIVDEADSILLDDLTNGTILSHPIKSNQNGVLKFIYESKMGKLSKFNLRRLTNYFGLVFKTKRDKNEFVENLSSSYQKLEYNEKSDHDLEYIASIFEFIKFNSKDQIPKSKVRYFIKHLWPEIMINNELMRTYDSIKMEFENKKLEVDLSKFIVLMVFICKTKTGLIMPNMLLEVIRKIWPDSCDLSEIQLNSMFDEIRRIQSNEFNNGKKYSIQEIKKKEKVKMVDGFSRFLGMISKKDDKGEEKEKRDPNDEDFEEEEEVIDESSLEYEIVPFDYDNKGILERNKEFDGFIQQFIAIKEMINDPRRKIKIKEMALNYSFVSHPILVKLYKYLFGFTGTIGNKNDKEVLLKQYNINTLKIPRNQTNRRVELPIILCKNIEERYQRIIEDVTNFHLLGNPVLVILQDLKEIDFIRALFEKKGIKHINVFDYNENDNKRNPEEVAGLNGEISFGTNFCGRGTNINNKNQKPLHIIVTYYSRNTRVIKQAFGRTARNGNKGTCRIICLYEQYIQPIEIRTNESISKTIDDIPLKLKYQLRFQNNFQFLFNAINKEPKIGIKDVIEMNCNINVNRLVAYNYKYPIGMSIETFLKIQTQKIFSLYNCPNSKYTWMLFQRYAREMILESWALKIKELEIEKAEFSEQNLLNAFDQLNRLIINYFPVSKDNIFNIFKRIYLIVLKEWQPRIEDLFKDSVPFQFFDSSENTSFSNSFFKVKFGFFPYILVDESGSKISCFDNNDMPDRFIKDPEISYLMKKDRSRFKASITEKVDLLFNAICQKIDETIGNFTGLRFFLRRTLSGCEFGVCINFCAEKSGNSIENCLFDKDPLLLFTFQTKSTIPILAGILIIVLVYTAKICEFVLNGIGQFISIFKKGVKKALIELVESLIGNVFDKEISKLFDIINGKLSDVLQKQLDKIRSYNKDSKVVKIISALSEVFNRKDYAEIKTGSLGKLGINVKIDHKASDKLDNFLPHLFKVAVNVLLCIVAFFMNFDKKNELNYDSHKYNLKGEANLFNQNQNVNDSINRNKEKILSEDQNYGKKY